MPKTTHTKTLTLTALALATFFTTLTPATATDTPATDQAIEQLTQTGTSVAEETNRLIVPLKDETTNKDVLNWRLLNGADANPILTIHGKAISCEDDSPDLRLTST